MKYADRIRQLLAAVSPTVLNETENRLWDAWLELEESPEPAHLIRLLGTDVRSEFKERALCVLLSPSLSESPIRWRKSKHDPHENYLFMKDIIGKTPADLLGFAGALVCAGIEYVPELLPDSAENTLAEYNRIILLLLAALPESEEVAQRLFEYYQINDLACFGGMDEASGYNPFRTILYAADIPLKWKELADARMRDRIVAERSGQAQPRAEWEDALHCYASHIQMANYDGKEGYDRKLFVSQLRFIAELPDIDKEPRQLFSNSQVIHLLAVLEGDDLREIRHKLARSVVLGKVDRFQKFSTFCPESRQAAEFMVQEFGETDPELAAEIKNSITFAEKQRAQHAASQRSEKLKAADVLGQMR